MSNELVVILKGLLKASLLPPGVLILGLMVSAGLCLRQPKRPKTALMLLTLAGLLYAFSLPWLATRSSAWIEASLKPLAVDAQGNYQIQAAQAIVILAGGLRSEAIDSPHPEQPNWRSLERINYGARLAKATGLPILVSGGVLPLRHTGSEAAAMGRALELDYGIKPRWLEERSLDTADNARFSAQILLNAGIKRVLLVTHAQHMWRSARLFENAGLEVVMAPAAFAPQPPSNLFSFMPNAHASARIYDNLHEVIGLLWARISG